jgi:hypothetical protein
MLPFSICLLCLLLSFPLHFFQLLHHIAQQFLLIFVHIILIAYAFPAGCLLQLFFVFYLLFEMVNVDGLLQLLDFVFEVEDL